jgi:muramoyltetrapeptide carboxypeptidase
MREETAAVIVPRQLNEESRVKVILPSSSLRATFGFGRAYARGYSLLQKHFSVENSQYWRTDYQRFAATDEERAAEFNEAFRSGKWHAVIAGRGGYGCLRMLAAVDFETIKQRPKLLLGFSDITILQLAMYCKIGLVSLSSPVVASLNNYNIQRLLPLLLGDSAGFDLISPANKRRIEVLQPGKAEGVLLGGNLYSMVQLIGAGYMPRLDNAIFFVEDVNETVDSIDSFLHHLKLAGLLYRITGVIIGDLSLSRKHLFTNQSKWRNLLRQRIASIFRKEIPVISGVDYGHISNSITIPIGVRAELDTESRSLTLLESVTHA